MTNRWVAAAFSLALVPALSHALTIGQVDTFQSGTTEGWFAGGGPGGGAPPVPPQVQLNGGPGGTGDAFMVVTAVGGGGAGSRLVVMNGSQWAGDYAAAGIAAIEMDLFNPGTTDLSIRLLLENPLGGPPTDEAITDAFTLAAGAGWVHAVFHVNAASLNVLLGDVDALLSNVTLLRIVHSPSGAFPPDPVVAQIGVDNIRAVPAPSTMLLVAMALFSLAIVRSPLLSRR